MATRRVARCCCGAVKVTVRGEPTLHALCHCANCKQRTGSAFGISAYFPQQHVESVVGEVVEYQVTTEHNEQIRNFCSTCGTTVYWSVSTLADFIGVAGGCFTEAPLDAPKATVLDEQRCSWVQLPAGLAQSMSE